MVYFAACRASTAWSKHSNAGFPLSTKDSGQNKAGMSRVTGPWALAGHLRATKANQRLAGHSSGGLGEVRCHGDGSAPVPEAGTGDSRCKVRFLSGKRETQRELTPVRRISMFCLKEVFLAHLLLENCVQSSELWTQ